MSTEQQHEQIARKAVDAIVADLSDRRGLRQQWEQINDDIREEILVAWRAAVAAAIAEAKS